MQEFILTATHCDQLCASDDKGFDTAGPGITFDTLTRDQLRDPGKTRGVKVGSFCLTWLAAISTLASKVWPWERKK